MPPSIRLTEQRMIDKLTIAVDSMEAMVSFYAAILDVEFSPVEMFGETLYAGHFGALELLMCPRELAQVRAETNSVQARFLVPDVDQAYQRGLERGGTTITAPALMEGSLHAALRDPDNNSVELKQQP